MLSEATPVYVNWEFWSAAVALLALGLTQIPPLHELFRRWFRPRRLEVEIQSRAQVAHFIGNPNLSMLVSVTNSGGRELRIRAIKVTLFRDETELGTLPAQNYFENHSPQSTVLFVPFTLKPDESWAHGTNFLNFFDRKTEKFYRDTRFAIRKDVLQKRQSLPKDDTRDVPVDPALITPCLALFERLFIWHLGEYVVELAVVAEPAAASCTKKYRFTLFESDAAELRSYTDDYAIGGGLAYNVDRHVGLYIPLSPVVPNKA